MPTFVSNYLKAVLKRKAPAWLPAIETVLACMALNDDFGQIDTADDGVLFGSGPVKFAKAAVSLGAAAAGDGGGGGGDGGAAAAASAAAAAAGGGAAAAAAGGGAGGGEAAAAAGGEAAAAGGAWRAADVPKTEIIVNSMVRVM
jgi:hypothetical protein